MNLTLFLLNILPIFTANISDSDEIRPSFVDFGRFRSIFLPTQTELADFGAELKFRRLRCRT